MLAAVYYGPRDIRVEQRPEPEHNSDNIVARVTCCAICGTDVKLATVGNPRCHPPRIIGHEMVGEVIHAGSDVRGFAPGDRITLATTLSCGDCQCCRLGLGNICPNAKPISYDFDGAFAELIAIPPQAIAGGNVVKVADSVPDESAALAEPLSCAINAQKLAGVGPGDSVLIVGGGPLGALHALLAKARGADGVMIVQRSQPRLSMLGALAGVDVIDGANEDVAAAVTSRTSGLGADVVIVCAPSKLAHEQAPSLVRKGGTISLFASLPKGGSDITLDSREIHYGELRIVGASDSRPEHVSEAIALMAAGKIDVGPVITHSVALRDLADGLRLMIEKQSMKVLVWPCGRR